MKQEEAVKVITAQLKQDPYVKAVFLKGSMGRNEHDENSDVDLYCLVDEEGKEDFLENRKAHVEAYGKLLFYDEIFIVAPQVLAVYDNMLHLDLFTVTDETFIEKDYFKVLYDPENRMEKFNQHLTLSAQEFIDTVDDTAFFLFQYEKSRRRGNAVWSVHMLHQVMIHFSRLLLHHYYPDRAQLGLKTVDATFSQNQSDRIKGIFSKLTIDDHEIATKLIKEWLKEEEAWVVKQIEDTLYTKNFLKRMIHGESR